MDFIETIFGVSPDGGTGATEVLFVVAVIAAAGVWMMRRRLRRLWLDRAG